MKLGNLRVTIVRRHYTDEVMLRWLIILQNKFDNVNTIAKDSCFHFAYDRTKRRGRWQFR